MSQDAPSRASTSFSASVAAIADHTMVAPTPIGSSPVYIESALIEDKLKKAFEVEQDDWDADPDNARNWSTAKKWTAVSIVSLYTFVSPLASSMMAPGLGEIAQKYGIANSTVAALTLSIYLLSYALGPLILAPLSEMYGRTWVLHISNLFSVAFNLGCAFSPTAGTLIGFRFLAGLAASAPIACGGGTIGDLFSERDRASALAAYNIGPLIGPVIGPIAGGFIAQTVGVKWVFIVLSVTCGLASIIGIPVLKETYGPVIRLRKAIKAGDPEAVARVYRVSNMRKMSTSFVWENLSRPVIMLSRSFICFILSLYMSFLYAFFSETYGFGPGIEGLCYIGLGLGFFLASIFSARTSDQIYSYLADKNGGKGKPEMRIPAMFIGSLLVPIGLFWYGWSAQAKIHWIMPIIGTGFFGFGMMCSFLPIQLYLVDAFRFAASAIAAASVLRSLLGFAFPLFGQQMFNALGLGGGNSLLAGLAIVLGIPFPIWIYFRGETIRTNNKVQM